MQSIKSSTSFQSVKSIESIQSIESKFSEYSIISYEDINSLSNKEFPNEAYADFMTLITKYNISNTTGNVFIYFFNKYSNLFKSSLPKSINQRHIYE